MHPNDLKEEITLALAAGSGTAGLKLRSEQEISEALGIPKYRIRKALLELEREGVLYRKRRAGTFVRKMPRIATIPQEPKIDPLQLLAPPKQNGKTQQDDQSPSAISQTSYRISVWGDYDFVSNVRKMELAGILKQAQQLGHRISIHSFVYEKDKLISFNLLKAQIQEHPFDGYIVVNRWSDVFNAAFEGLQAPVIFVDTHKRYAPGPLISLDLDDGLEQAVEQFVRAGYKRIAFLGYCSEEGYDRQMVATYDRARQLHELEYRRFEWVYDLAPESTRQAIRRLMTEGACPEAIYVADDYLLAAAAQTLEELGYLPGQNVAVITLSNKGMPLAGGYPWSAIEFNEEEVGRMALVMLSQVLSHPTYEPFSLALLGKWKPGATHLLKNK